jgi:hypothetical protein
VGDLVNGISTKELAEQTGYSEAHITLLIRQGKMPANYFEHWKGYIWRADLTAEDIKRLSKGDGE